MREYELVSSAPLIVMFDQPLSEMKLRFQSLVDASDDLLIEGSTDQSFSSEKIHHGSIGFDIIWSEEEPVLSGYRSVFFNASVSGKSTLLSVSLGENLAGGQLVAPIAKALLVFGARIASQLSAGAVMWTPAKIISNSAFFIENVENYAKGEVFPVLVTVDFDYEENERKLRSSGLAWFAGQEIELSGCDLHGQDLVRRAVRLVHDIATNGAIVLAQQVPDLDADKLIELTPVPDSQILRSEIYAKSDETIRATSVH